MRDLAEQRLQALAEKFATVAGADNDTNQRMQYHFRILPEKQSPSERQPSLRESVIIPKLHAGREDFHIHLSLALIRQAFA
jgi:hypothetical protein